MISAYWGPGLVGRRGGLSQVTATTPTGKWTIQVIREAAAKPDVADRSTTVVDPRS
jgi:hypothetical protein